MHFSTRVGIVGAGVVATVGLSATAALANWSSYISSWTDGDQSRRWADSAYSQVQFKGCFAQYGTTDSVNIQLNRDISGLPDAHYDTKTFTNCFNGSNYWSNGEWTSLPSGNYYFEATKVAQGGSCCLLFVDYVYQDTTSAD
ncbi:MAG TPA: hypothetical protein VGJ41_15980 [Nocardioides sp.]